MPYVPASHGYQVKCAKDVTALDKLGILREWRRGKHRWAVRIEFSDRRSPSGSIDMWFQFEPASIDPLAVDPETGIVLLLPPRLRGGAA